MTNFSLDSEAVRLARASASEPEQTPPIPSPRSSRSRASRVCLDSALTPTMSHLLRTRLRRPPESGHTKLTSRLSRSPTRDRLLHKPALLSQASECARVRGQTTMLSICLDSDLRSRELAVSITVNCL